MKKSFIYTALTVILVFAFSSLQNVQAATEIHEKDSVYTIIDTPPSFVGGDAAMYKFLSETLVYPVVAQENNIQGRVIVQFVVDEKGKILDPRVVRSIDPSLDEEALRVINAMPTWNPGKHKGKPVKARYTIPIAFSLVGGPAKTETNKPIVDDGKQHLGASKGLEGVWRLTQAMDRSGALVEVNTGSFKIMNYDGTFYAFTTWSGKAPAMMTLYGSYTITSDSTCIEKIVQSGVNSAMNGTTSEIRYKLIDENTLHSEYKNEVTGIWIPEVWKRVEMIDLKKLMESQK